MGCDSHLSRFTTVVYAKPPFGGPRQVLKYLARYTHRVAISNQRLVAVENGEVTFRWKDYTNGNRQRTMTLDAVEFIRRFLLHALPRGFQRLRHFGFLADCVRQEKLPLCRKLLAHTAPPPLDDPGNSDAIDPDSPALPPEDDFCPTCKIGRMRVVEILDPLPVGACIPPLVFDTS